MRWIHFHKQRYSNFISLLCKRIHVRTMCVHILLECALHLLLSSEITKCAVCHSSYKWARHSPTSPQDNCYRKDPFCGGGKTNAQISPLVQTQIQLFVELDDEPTYLRERTSAPLWWSSLTSSTSSTLVTICNEFCLYNN